MRSKPLPIITVVLICMMGCNNAPEPHVPTTEPAQYYKDFLKDRELLRKTCYLDKPGLNASSGDACAAANRIFKNAHFVGMTKKEVLTVLGDPKTISDYGIAAGKGDDAPLIYVFDHGWGGCQYTLHFKDSRVVEVEEIGLE